MCDLCHRQIRLLTFSSLARFSSSVALRLSASCTVRLVSSLLTRTQRNHSDNEKSTRPLVMLSIRQFCTVLDGVLQQYTPHPVWLRELPSFSSEVGLAARSLECACVLTSKLNRALSLVSLTSEHTAFRSCTFYTHHVEYSSTVSSTVQDHAGRQAPPSLPASFSLLFMHFKRRVRFAFASNAYLLLMYCSCSALSSASIFFTITSTISRSRPASSIAYINGDKG